MIFYSARVENYKGVRGPIDTTFDPDTPNVVDGPNGVGKSTLLEAVLCCLVEGYNTAGAAAEQMRPWETALTPSISVVFGHSGSVYRISKTFLDSPKSLLERRRADGVFEAIAKGKTADEQVRTLLRTAGGRSKEKPGERLGLLSVLCSTQGGQELPPLSGDALADIRGMLGAQVSGAQGIAFERAVNKKYLSVWTPGGKARAGKLTATQDALVHARSDAQQCSALLQRAVDSEASARAKRALHQEKLDQLRVAQAEYRPVADTAQQISDLCSRRTPARSRVEAATARYDQLHAEIERIHGAAKKKRGCEEARPRLEESLTSARMALDSHIAQAQGAQRDWEAVSGPNPQIQDLEARIDRCVSLQDAGREIAALEVRLERATSAAARRKELEASIAALNAPDPAMWRSIQAAGREFDEATLRVAALELRIEILAECALSAEVLVGDPAGTTRLAAGETVVTRGDGHLKIRLPGVATLDISGPSGDAAAWRAKRNNRGAAVDRLLQPFGVATWQELVDRAAERETLAIELATAKAEYEAAIGTDELAILQDRERELGSRRAAILLAEPGWVAQAPEVAALKDAAEAMKLEWLRRQAEMKARWQSADRLRADAESKAASVEAGWTSNEAALADAQRDLEALECDGRSIEERTRELNNRRRECESAETALAEIDAALGELPADAPAIAAAKAAAIELLESEIQTARECYQHDEVAAKTLLQQGPYSSLAVAEERVRQLEVEEAAETARLDAIARLRAAVERAKAKALAGIAEPVERGATKLLERIVGRPFGRIRLGEGLELESLQPDGCTGDAALKQMSAGEREQIYFATRLALADVLCTGERQVVVLDDPLVDTDADRLSRALALIDERTDRMQFVILTCHAERYLSLPKLASRHLEAATSEVCS